MPVLTRTLRRLPLALLLAGVALAACGPQVIKGRPPFISIAGMSLVDNALSAEFRISNQNGVPMTIQSIDIEVAVNGTELTRQNSELQLVIDANSAEEVVVERLPDDFTRKLLASLENREVVSLPFELNGKVRTVEDGYLRVEQKGHLYPVPGKPGFFRSAVTQAQDLRREDRL